MSSVSTITDLVVSTFVSAITPAILAVLGALTTLVFATWGVLKVYAYLKGESSGDVSYKIGRIFGELVDEERYQSYKKERDRVAVRSRYGKRYRDEN